MTSLFFHMPYINISESNNANIGKNSKLYRKSMGMKNEDIHILQKHHKQLL